MLDSGGELCLCQPTESVSRHLECRSRVVIGEEIALRRGCHTAGVAHCLPGSLNKQPERNLRACPGLHGKDFLYTAILPTT